jgi:hypothetical protein
LGATKTPIVAPACPKGATGSSCTIILTESTAVQTVRDSVSYPTTVTKAGYLVAWTIGLSRLSTNSTTARNAIHYLDSTYGGNARAAITVLAPVGSKRLRRWQVVAQSPIVHLQPWLGYIVQFPLLTPLRVRAGDTVALSVPTWAPVLSIDLPAAAFAYRQSRTTGCTTAASTEQAQLTIGATAQYLCNYPGTRLEYSATEVTSPGVPDNQLH